MPQQLDRSKLDSAALRAIADVLQEARTAGAPFQAFVRAGRSNLCVSAVEAPAGAVESEFFEAAARRASTRGRRLLPVVDSGEIDGCLWIAYEVGSNKPLPEYRKHLLLPTATWLRVLGDVARAIDEAAERRVFAYEVGPD